MLGQGQVQSRSRSPKAVNEGSSISLKCSPFFTINEIRISWKFQLHTYYQSIFVVISNFWLFRKSSTILEINFWKIEFSEASSPNFPSRSPESVPGSAKIISWFFRVRKNISFQMSKSAKIGGSLKIFQNLGPCNSRMGLF